MHSIIDSLNPVLRSSEMCNGRLRVHEFYAMTPEEAYKIFEAMANIHACPQAYERQELCPWFSLLQIQRRVAQRNPHPSWGVKLL